MQGDRERRAEKDETREGAQECKSGKTTEGEIRAAAAKVLPEETNQREDALPEEQLPPLRSSCRMLINPPGRIDSVRPDNSLRADSLPRFYHASPRNN